MTAYKILWIDIDDPNGEVGDSIYEGKDAAEAMYELTRDCSGSGVDIEILSVSEYTEG